MQTIEHKRFRTKRMKGRQADFHSTQVVRLVLVCALFLPLLIASRPSNALVATGPIVDLALSADGQFLYAHTGSTLSIWRGSNENWAAHASLRTRPCAFSAISIGGGRLSSSSNQCGSRPTELWHATQAAPGMRQVLGPIGAYRALGFDRAGERLAVATSDGRIHLYSLAGQDRIRTIRLGAATEYDPMIELPLAFSSDLRYLAVRDWRDYYVSIYEVDSGARLHRSEYYVRDHSPVFAFSLDGNRYFDGVRVRDSESGVVLAELPQEDCCYVRRAAFSPEGTALAILRHGKTSAGAVESIIQIHELRQTLPVASPAESEGDDDMISSESQNSLPDEVVRISERIEDLAWDQDSSGIFLGGATGRVHRIVLEGDPRTMPDPIDPGSEISVD